MAFPTTSYLRHQSQAKSLSFNDRLHEYYSDTQTHTKSISELPPEFTPLTQFH